LRDHDLPSWYILHPDMHLLKLKHTITSINSLVLHLKPICHITSFSYNPQSFVIRMRSYVCVIITQLHYSPYLNAVSLWLQSISPRYSFFYGTDWYLIQFQRHRRHMKA